MLNDDWTWADAKMAWDQFKGTWPLDVPYLRVVPIPQVTINCTEPIRPERPREPIELTRKAFTERGESFVGVFWRGQEIQRWYE